MADFQTEAAQFARRIVMSEAYQNRLRSRAESGDLPAGVETLLLHYALGKPVEHVSVIATGEQDLGAMTVEQLVARAQHVYRLLCHRQEEDRALAEAQARAREMAEQQAQRQQAEAQARQAEEAQSVFHQVDRKVH